MARGLKRNHATPSFKLAQREEEARKGRIEVQQEMTELQEKNQKVSRGGGSGGGGGKGGNGEEREEGGRGRKGGGGGEKRGKRGREGGERGIRGRGEGRSKERVDFEGSLGVYAFKILIMVVLPGVGPDKGEECVASGVHQVGPLAAVVMLLDHTTIQATQTAPPFKPPKPHP